MPALCKRDASSNNLCNREVEETSKHMTVHPQPASLGGAQFY